MYQHIVVGTDGSNRAPAEVAAAGGVVNRNVTTARRFSSRHEMKRVNASLPEELRDRADHHLDTQHRFSEAPSISAPSISIVSHQSARTSSRVGWVR